MNDPIITLIGILLLFACFGTFCNIFISSPRRKGNDMYSLSTLKKKNKQQIAAEKKAFKEAMLLEKKQIAAAAELKELDVKVDPINILELLKDKKKLDVVLRKLKLKMFW